jgi:hypothetical protein
MTSRPTALRPFTAAIAVAALLLAAASATPARAQDDSESQSTDSGPEVDKLVSPVHMQDVLNNPEYGPGIEGKRPSADKPLNTAFTMRSEVHSYNNLDLRPLKETSDLDVITTDDRHTFAYSTIIGEVQYLVAKPLHISISLAHNGLWGEDQLGQAGMNTGVLSFYELAMHYTPVQTSALSVNVSLGRQPFSIGDAPRDYVLDDVLDALVIEVNARKAGRLRILAFDYFSANDLPSASFVGYIGGKEPVLGLRGDTYTLRTGGLYENVGTLVKGLMFKAYVFYADIGGGPVTETGADISYGGSLGNFSDNDWNMVAGGRAGYTYDFGTGTAGLYVDGAYSKGVDRKEAVARDTKADGLMIGGGIGASVSPSDSFKAELALDFYRFDGAEYDENGLVKNHGFVGFKGRQVGGLSIDRYAGWHPSAYVGSGGIERTPQNIENIGGKQFLHAGLKLTILQDLMLQGDFWMYQDTSSTKLDMQRLITLDPPFGYSREEFAAEARLGKSLGNEVNVQASYQALKELQFYASSGLFMPGDFYKIPIARVAGTSLGGQATFWGISGGAVVHF